MVQAGKGAIVKRRSPRKLSLIVVLLTAFAGAASAQQGEKQPPLALEGHCAVCLVKANKWVKGSADHATTHDGRRYYFPSNKEKQAFSDDPVKFVPALNGDCIVCFATGGVRQPGSIQHSATHAGRIFLFPGPKEKDMFIADPAKFANADLAAGGNCAVCKVMAGKDVPGKPEFTALYNGLRYQFPSDKERQMFLKDPGKFVPGETGKQSSNRSDGGTAPGAKLVSVVGVTGCAACEHGVKPLGSPGEMGLAITGADGKVYVVEDANKLYADIYKQRFDGLKVQLSGTPIQTQGKFVWVKPKSVSVTK